MVDKEDFLTDLVDLEAYSVEVEVEEEVLVAVRLQMGEWAINLDTQSKTLSGTTTTNVCPKSSVRWWGIHSGNPRCPRGSMLPV